MPSLFPITRLLSGFTTGPSTPPRRDLAAVASVRRAAAELVDLPDAALTDRADRLREEVRASAEPTDRGILVPAFALAHEAVRRATGLTLYDVQLLAALVLARGAIAEMRTGEGKTLAAVPAVFARSLTGKGVHVMTANEYLAKRDGEQLQGIFTLLGASAGVTLPGAEVEDKRAAYHCDITYGSGSEFGFDYLRDQVARIDALRQRTAGSRYLARLRGESDEPPESIQRGHVFSVVDEIDSVLIDDANSPLLLAASVGTPAPNTYVFHQARDLARNLAPGEDFVNDPGGRRLALTRRGIEKIHTPPESVPSAGLDRAWSSYVEQALFAHYLLVRDDDYLVRDDKIELIDESTGRIYPGRNLRDGLHQAVEAKEAVTVTAEYHSLGRISRQRYFQLYADACGMTGTAWTNRREFEELYSLPVVPIPTRRPCIRKLLPARYFATQEAKWDAVVEETRNIHARRQPILIGTRTIEASELLAERLAAAGIAHQVLNGVQDAEEADIVARAGLAGSITIATNMAGRGTDIKLGEGVIHLGGLYVIVTEPHDSARIDRQLIGRAARQGDPGACRFFVSAEDRLLELHGKSLVARLTRKADARGEFHGDLFSEIVHVQHRLESLHFELRRRMFAYDDWLEKVIERLEQS